MYVFEPEAMFRDAGDVGGDIQTGPSFERQFYVVAPELPVIEMTVYVYPATDDGYDIVQTAIHLTTFDNKGQESTGDVRYWSGMFDDGETAESRCQSINREDIFAALDQMGF